MNAMKARKRYDEEQRYKAYKEAQEAEKERVDAMSEEDRQEYLAKKKKRQREAMSLLSIGSLVGGPYSNMKY